MAPITKIALDDTVVASKEQASVDLGEEAGLGISGWLIFSRFPGASPLLHKPHKDGSLRQNCRPEPIVRSYEVKLPRLPAQWIEQH